MGIFRNLERKAEVLGLCWFGPRGLTSLAGLEIRGGCQGLATDGLGLFCAGVFELTPSLSGKQRGQKKERRLTLGSLAVAENHRQQRRADSNQTYLIYKK